MGLATSTMRLMYLNAYRLDLEADDPIVKKLEARKERLNIMEKKLDMQLQEYQHKLKMIDEEMESCNGLIEKNIKMSFKY